MVRGCVQKDGNICGGIIQMTNQFEGADTIAWVAVIFIGVPTSLIALKMFFFSSGGYSAWQYYVWNSMIPLFFLMMAIIGLAYFSASLIEGVFE